MKRKFFIRRALIFFLIMLVPTVILFGVFLAVGIRNAADDLAAKGEQTIASALNDCEVMIERTYQQNDLLTGTTRMNVSLSRALHQNEMTYGDSVFLTALGSLVRSTISSNPPLERIMIWLDGAPRLFSSTGSSIQPVAQLEDQRWKAYYEQMPAGQSDMLVRLEREDGGADIVSIRRLLLQKGCTVVTIDAEAWASKLVTYLQRSHEHLVLIGEDGSVLLHATNDEGAAWRTDEAFVRALLSAQSGEWVSTEAGRFLVTHAQMDRLRLVAAVPWSSLSDMLLMIRQTFAGLLVVNLCVVMLLAYLTTRRICSQMMLMIDMLDDAIKGRPVTAPARKRHDEYDVIMNNILYIYLREVSLRSELQQKQYQQEHAELMALQLQINPHFLYNTLQTLEITIRGGMADRYDLCDIIRAISDILKYALSDPQQTVTLENELHYLKEYAAVQKFRFGGRFVIYYEVEDELLDAEVFRLMLQPLVENSMIHGLKDLKERGYIWVRASREGDMLRVSVEDSGAGMSPDELEALRSRIRDANSRSIGLTNLNRRLMLRYGEEGALKIASAPGKGTRVSFAIALKRREGGGAQEVSSDAHAINKDTKM